MSLVEGAVRTVHHQEFTVVVAEVHGNEDARALVFVTGDRVAHVFAMAPQFVELVHAGTGPAREANLVDMSAVRGGGPGGLAG